LSGTVGSALDISAPVPCDFSLRFPDFFLGPGREPDPRSTNTMDRNSTPKYPVPEYDHSGLEAVPIPHLETGSWHHQQQDMGHGPPSTTWVEPPQVANLPAKPRQRILGLSVKTFWILIVLLVVIVAGGVGGGVGGGLAARGSST